MGRASTRIRNWASLRRAEPRSAGFPAVMDVEPTNLCNLKCTMCPRTKLMTRGLGMMPGELFRGLVDQAAGRTEYIYLDMMGEPTLHPEICDMISYAEGAGIRTSLSTNCLELGDDVARRIVDSGLSILIMSIDASRPETYRKVRGGDLERVVRNVDRLLATRRVMGSAFPLVILQFIRVIHNEDEVEDFYKRFKPLSPDMIVVRDCHDWAGSMDSGDYAPATTLGSARARSASRRPQPCRTLWHQATVLWNGDVTVCCYDYDGTSVVGNLNRNSMAEIWNSPGMLEYRRRHLEGRYREVECCRRCHTIPPHGLRSFLAGGLDSELLKVIRWYGRREGDLALSSRWGSLLHSYRLAARLELGRRAPPGVSDRSEGSH